MTKICKSPRKEIFAERCVNNKLPRLSKNSSHEDRKHESDTKTIVKRKQRKKKTDMFNFKHEENSSDEVLLVGRFRRGSKIGTGSFGDVYVGHDIINKTPVAIKQELRESKTFNREIEIVRHLQLMDSKMSIPKLYFDGTQHSTYKPRFFVMELLGQNLSDLHKMCGGTFTCPTVCLIAREIITRFEEIHEQGVVHRDVKPQNFLISRTAGDKTVFICDFGLSGRYVDGNGSHILFQTGLKPIGTARYASMRVHRGYERSRRDDFEALAYVLIYLINGRLPWQGLKLKDRQHKWKVILAKKKEATLDELCQNCPVVLNDFVVHCRAMRFNQRPKYAYWRKRFMDTFREMTDVPEEDFRYDWEH